MFETLDKIDMDLLRLIYDNLSNNFLDRVMPFITFLGDGGVIWIAVCVTLIISKRYRQIGVTAAIALILTWIAGDIILKPLIHRLRPFMEIPSVKLLIKPPASYSFPSGHSASAFSVSAVLLKSNRGAGIPFMVLAALIAFSRIYLFVHYPFDVIGGIALGLICSKASFSLSEKLLYNIS